MSMYGLLGQHLAHSWSPQIHEQLGTTPYTLCEVAPDGLADFLEKTELTGLNVTIPYKKAVIPYCAELSETARATGSVNTMLRRENGWYGDNTDFFGFCYLCKAAGITVADKKALVFGSGGVSGTVCAALRSLGARQVVVISRTGENNYQNLYRHKDAEILVNATPVGMFPDNGTSPVDLADFPRCSGVLDLIYNPLRTALLIQAEQLHIPNANGLWMLAAQALKSAELFLGHALDEAKIAGIVTTLQKQMENIILIGMPGCGKSTVGAILAQRLHREHLDADMEIRKTVGTTIPEIFANSGEDGFRELEAQVLSSLGKKTGVVISTGGGCVTRPENYAALHQNGRIIWLQRDISLLPTDGRPLSQNAELSELYRVRAPLYESFVDMCINNDGTAMEAVRKIKEALQ